MQEIKSRSEILPLSLWHNRGYQTTPFSKQSVTRLKITGKKLSEKHSKQIKGEVHIKIMTIKKGYRHSLSRPNKSNQPLSKGLMRKTLFLVVFQRTIKPHSHTGGKKVIVNLDFLEVHIHNIMTTTAPRHSLTSPTSQTYRFSQVKILREKRDF